MAMMPLEIKIDVSEARAAIAECLEPGSVLLREVGGIVSPSTATE